MFPKTEVKDSDLKDEADDSWLDVPADPITPSTSLKAEVKSPVNLASSFLATFLAEDNPKRGSAKDVALEGPAEDRAADGDSGNDDDFKMEFD